MATCRRPSAAGWRRPGDDHVDRHRDLDPPTVYINRDGQEETIDGLKFQFLSGARQRSPVRDALVLARTEGLDRGRKRLPHDAQLIHAARRQLHYLLAWSKYLQKSVRQWGGKAEVLYSMHNWPVSGRGSGGRDLERQRDLYRFINDETLRLANQGLSMTEIAETIRLPESLDNWSNRGYYGTLNHNVKGTYVFYLGWFNGNPATLHPLPPDESSKKYVEYMGGTEADFEKNRTRRSNKGRLSLGGRGGESRRVRRSGESPRAKRIASRRATSRSGYQAESGPSRNFYLSGAKELRNGINRDAARGSSVGDVE